MREDIKKILEVSVNAPSGSNSQPWEFKVKDNEIHIYALPEKDHPILNFRYRGTWIAHGALLENILISSSALRYRAKYRLFPEKNNPNLVSIITLEHSDPKEDPLYGYIPRRTTNRKRYDFKPLTVEQETELLRSAQEVGGGDIRFVKSRNDMKTFGESGSVNEIVMLENKLLHKLFFDEIVWTEGEEKAKGSGLYLKTMELKPPQRFILKFVKHWPIMSFLNKLGLARMIAKDNSKTYQSGALAGAIVVADKDEDFIAAGRIMQRIWLKATKLGLGFHLITGVLFFSQKIASGETKVFSEEHIKLIRDAYQKIASVFNVSSGIIAIAFRIGYDGEPSARSIKLTPKIVYT